MKAYTARCGKQQYKPSKRALMAAAEEGTTGFCLACGAEQTGVEPDMRKGRCETCSEFKVYGAEELLLMCLYH